MKVETQDPKFKPVTITLETQEEVDLLNALLECEAVSDYMEGIFPDWGRALRPYANEENVSEFDGTFNEEYRAS